MKFDTTVLSLSCARRRRRLSYFIVVRVLLRHVRGALASALASSLLLFNDLEANQHCSIAERIPFTVLTVAVCHWV